MSSILETFNFLSCTRVVLRDWRHCPATECDHLSLSPAAQGHTRTHTPPHLVYCKTSFLTGPQVRRGYPPNLSISFSGGKETKKDSLSNGERKGKSPAPNCPPLGGVECGVWEHLLSHEPGSSKSVGTRPPPEEGDRPVGGSHL